MRNSATILYLLFMLVTACGPQHGEQNGPDKILGVKIYNYNKPLPPLFEEWKQLGINTVFTDPSLYAIDEFRELTGKYNIKTFLILPIFFDAIELHKNPQLYAITEEGKLAIDDWVEFVCPDRKSFRQKKIRYIRRLVETYHPDGLSIDFIRNFVYWEKVYPGQTLQDLHNTCYDDSCMTDFQTETGIKFPDSLYAAPQYAAWINENAMDPWVRWKCSLITNMVRDIVKAARAIDPGIQINVHAVPWREKDFGGAARIVAGQDLRELNKYTDYISPMTYEHMVKRDPPWIHSVVKDFYRQTNGRIIPSIQVNRSYLDKPLTVNEFRESIKQSLKSPSGGVIFWSWDQLDDQPAKKAIVKEEFEKLKK